ncbi:DUF6456 domain-containing protein [Paracoccus sp. Z330]|uniref:DUF6456 domain-containing protein n=1 Tax=Paracoccus onchidii TaxID=3017813 RepID=A0ABT4ZF09_9RHOB|nr:DUF6456 domain-containing protein [Paracoccus onchidii]MDB6177906.1 DUF6456 domain-containing protein [Paracoccus onchidii]
MTVFTGDFTIEAGGADHRSEIASVTATRTDLPEDARLYLRHVEDGVTIRALAREAGCHASTILRRIRRFEARRDDPLIDRALSPERKPSANDDATTLRILRRLAEPGAVLASAEGMDKAIVSRNDIRTAVLERDLAEMMALRGWVAMISNGGRIQRYAIAPAGREALRALLSRSGMGAAVPGPGDFSNATPVDLPSAQGDVTGGNATDHAEQHRVWEERKIQDPEDGKRRTARVNIAESPLLLLARRRDRDGKPFLSAGMVTAGERLREDFELAQMGPRVTQNWTGFLTAGIDRSFNGGGYRGGSESARDRVATALRELGPGMGDVVLRVCCYLEGIEMTERRLGWSARSGKIVLRLALMRLERHYEEVYGGGSRLIG